MEQCENLEEVETFLQTKTHDGLTHKDANYIIAILDSRKKFVAHERFQYVLLKKFGEIDLPVSLFPFSNGFMFASVVRYRGVFQTDDTSSFVEYNFECL